MLRMYSCTGLMHASAVQHPRSRREDGHEGVMEPWWPARLEGLRARRVMRHDSNDWQNECMRLRNDRDSVKDSGVLYMKYLNASVTFS